MKRALAERVKQEVGDEVRHPPCAPPEYHHHGMNGGVTSIVGDFRGGGVNSPSLSLASGMTFQPISASPRDNQMNNTSSSSGKETLPMEVQMPSTLSATATTSTTVNKKRPRSPPDAYDSGNGVAYSRSSSQNGESNSSNGGVVNGAMTMSSSSATLNNGNNGRVGPGRPRKSEMRDDNSNNNGPADGGDEEEVENSSFYLKLQNASLASELYAYRRRIYLLEREREFRRKECRVAGRKIGELSGAWRGLECAIGKELEINALLQGPNISVSCDSTDAPSCTGSGSDVETIHSLLHSLNCLVTNSEKIQSIGEDSPQDDQYHVDELNNFESYSKGTVKMEEDEDLVEEKRQLQEMDDFATNIAARAAILRDGVLGLLRNYSMSQGVSSNIDAALLKEQIALLESELELSESRLEEMAQSRNEAVASERRVRRGLYRLASGRMTVDDVLKAVEKDDNGVSFMETLAMIDGMNSNRGGLFSPDGTTAMVTSSDQAFSSPAHSAAAADSPAANAEEVAQMKKSLQDVQAIADERDKMIVDLRTERDHLNKRITSLLIPKNSGNDIPSDEANRKSSLFIEALSKVATSEIRVKEVEYSNEKIMEKWASVKGDLDLAKKTLEELDEKHGRRWTELVSQFSDAELNNNIGSVVDATANGNGASDVFSTARRTAELESKLQQALESVSRMETLRSTLAEAYKMNEQLQSKLEDLRTKNAKMVAEKLVAREKTKEAESSAPADALTPPSNGSSSKRKSIESAVASTSTDPTIEKLQKDYRKARKEFAAAVLSKDQAKLKQERAEKERDALMKTNARLLKQSSDKDDMNAKSLSTILHLKQRNEELEKENDVLKQKVQAAQQLSLAARLASNAKERVGEEALKEKELLDETVKQLKEECLSIRKEKEQVECLLAQSKENIASITKDLDTARARCDELVSESNVKEDERKRVYESLAVVKRESEVAILKAAASSNGISSGGNIGGGTASEGLNAQVKYLSNKVHCPVCNVRDKNCILLRCRHMFCHQCVDVTVKNRSRKCPACAQRFDMKDVAEIWL